MFKDIKIDFPAVLAVNIFITFALVIILNATFKVPVDADLKQVLITIVTLMVGFYFGSSAGSKTKDESQNKIVEKLTATQPAGAPGPVAPVAAATVAWWSLLTDAERKAITEAAPHEQRVQNFTIAAAVGKAETDDLAYLVTKGLLTQDRATAIASS